MNQAPITVEFILVDKLAGVIQMLLL